MKRSFRNLEFPSEIWVQILARSPPESILRCRRVCKSWNKMILKPYFAQLHQSLTRRTLLVVHSSELGIRFGFVELKSSSGNGDLVVVPITLDWTDTVIDVPPFNLFFIGSNNGLVFLRGYFGYGDDTSNLLVLCNPKLGNHIFLPNPPPPQDCFTRQYMFGYLPSTRQYKAVKVDDVLIDSGDDDDDDEDDHREKLVFHICTIESGKPPSPWKTIDGGELENPYSVAYFHHAFVDETMVWIAGDLKNTWKSLIYFDILTEQSGILPLPRTLFQRANFGDERHAADCLVHMGVYRNVDGKTVLYLGDERPSCVNIWVMEDCKRIESLRLEWVIQLPHAGRVPVRLFNVLKDGRLLISIANLKLAYYQPNTGVIQYIDGPEFPEIVDLAVDTPSFSGCLIDAQN